MSYKVLQEDSFQGGYDPHPVPPQTQGGVSQPPPYMMSNVADYQPAPPAMGAQQQTNTNVVVATQPQMYPEVTVLEPPPPRTKPITLIFTAVLSIVCGVHLFVPVFVCLIPALILAIVAYNYRDDPEEKSTAKALNGVALCCNVATLTFYGICAVAAIIYLIIYFAVIYTPCDSSCSYTDYIGQYHHHCC